MADKLWLGAAGTEGDYSVSANWSPSGVPVASTGGDDVRIPAGSAKITAGLNQSAVAIGDFIVEEGHANVIGVAHSSSVAASYLRIDPDRFIFAGGGVSYIDIGSANIDAQINGSATQNLATGRRGLYLKGSNIDELVVNKGIVGLAALSGETSTVATARVGTLGGSNSNTSLLLGAGVTLTTYEQSAGNNVVRCNGTTLNLYAGILTSEEAAAFTTINMYGGTFYPNATGTITTLNHFAGTIDVTRMTQNRTISTLVLYDNATFIGLGAAYLTVTTLTIARRAKFVTTPL